MATPIGTASTIAMAERDHGSEQEHGSTEVIEVRRPRLMDDEAQPERADRLARPGDDLVEDFEDHGHGDQRGQAAQADEQPLSEARRIPRAGCGAGQAQGA